MYPYGYAPYYAYESFYGPPYKYGYREGYNGFWLGLAVVLLILLFLFGSSYFPWE